MIIPKNEEKVIVEFSSASEEIIVEKNAKLKMFSLYFGQDVEEKHSIILKENAQVEYYLLFFGKDKDNIEINGSCVHQGSNSVSRMNVCGVLLGEAKAKFDGLIRVEKKAVNCQGYQQEHALLCGERAKAMLIPNLEIANNEVQCSHGATVSKIDEEQLFYLTSRGIAQKEAEKMLIEGFLNEIINILPVSYQEQARRKLDA